LKGYVMNSIDV